MAVESQRMTALSRLDASERRGLLLVALAVLFFSTSPVLVRWAAPLSPYEIAVIRLSVAGVGVAGLAWLGHEAGILRRDWPRFILYGLITALHFVLYIASLQYTTIAHSLAIVYTSPIFVTLCSSWFLGERIARRKWWGVAIAVIGVAILAGFEPHLRPGMLLGDAMALGSAVMFGFYSVAGRSQRNQYSLFRYASTVYLSAALWALPLALLNLTPQGYGGTQILAGLGLGIIPLGLGHTLYNAALRRVHATYVNLIATQEVSGGILLGVLLLGEIPSVVTLVGALIALAGIVMVIL